MCAIYIDKIFVDVDGTNKIFRGVWLREKGKKLRAQTSKKEGMIKLNVNSIKPIIKTIKLYSLLRC